MKENDIREDMNGIKFEIFARMTRSGKKIS